MKRLLLIFFVSILVVYGGSPLCAQQWARPIHLTGQKTKVVKQDTCCFFLMDSMWIETKGQKNGDLIFDTLVLKNDNAKGANKYTNSKEADSIKSHVGLSATLTWKRIEYKYDTTVTGLPDTLKDKVLNVRDSLILLVKGENEKFRLIVNDTVLLDSVYCVGKPVLIDTMLLYGDFFGLNKGVSGKIAIRRIVMWPYGHVPSFIKELNYVVEENRSKVFEFESVDVNEMGVWDWAILLASLIVIGLCFVYGICQEKKRKKEENKKRRRIRRKRQTRVCKKINDELFSKQEFEKMRQQFEEEKTKIVEENKILVFGLQKGNAEAISNKEKAFAKVKKELEGRIETLENEKDKAIAKKEEEFGKERKKLNEEIEEKTQKVKTIENEVRNEMQKKVDEVNGKLDKITSELSRTKTNLDATSADLKKTKNDLANEQEMVGTLKETQRQYTDKIVITPWASQYAAKILSLTDLCKRIYEASKKLMEVEVEDKYFIIKAIAQYDMNINEIDLQRFYTDLYMAANKQMAFVDSGVANLATVDTQQQPRALRQYFLSAYLEKYVNAIVVLNESLAGLHRLVPDLPASETSQFTKFRTELEKCFSELEIKVISVKLFDKITNNVDVKAKEIDFDDNIPADSILEIRNCIVYAADGKRPNEKIYVKSQK